MHDDGSDAKQLLATTESEQGPGLSVHTARRMIKSKQPRPLPTAGRQHTAPVAMTRKARRLSTRNTLRPQCQTATGRAAVVIVHPDGFTGFRLAEIVRQECALTVTLVSEGFCGLVKIAQHKPLLVIADLDAKGFNGEKMIRILRADPSYRSIRFIGVTARAALPLPPPDLPPDTPLLPILFSRKQLLVALHAALG